MAGIKKLAKRSPIYVIHNGDLTQGSKYQDELVSTRLSDQIIMATDCLRAIAAIKNVKALRIVSGTPSHDFGEASAAELVADRLANEFKDKSILSTDH